MANWIHSILPHSKGMCLGYVVMAILCIVEGVQTVGSQRLMVGRRGGRTPLLEGQPAVMAGGVFFLVALVLLWLCYRYLREMRDQYQGFD